MIAGKRVLAVISARGGSKGVPGKNIRSFGGKPLLQWSIEQGKASRYIDRLIVSSEDSKILECAKNAGCEVPFVRPPELALDHVPGIEPVLHAIGQLPGFDFVVLLQPTSPLRTVEEIDACIEECALRGAPVCVTIAESPKNPYWMYSITGEKKLQPILNLPEQDASNRNRQSLPKVYCTTGSVYVANAQYLVKHRSYITRDTRGVITPSETAIDIDTELDFALGEFLLARKK